MRSDTACLTSFEPKTRLQPDGNGRMPKMVKRSRIVIDKRHKLDLCKRDRWRAAEMLRSQPELRDIDSARDLDLWRHLFDADDLVVVGERTSPAAELLASEYCWGNIWRNGYLFRRSPTA